MVFEIYAYPFGFFFGAVFCEIDDILMSFYPWFSFDVAYLVFFKSSQVSMKHGFASGHGNKLERISSILSFEWTKFEFYKNRTSSKYCVRILN